MTTQENTQLIRDLYDAFEKGDLDRAYSFLDPNAEFRVIGMDKPARGHQEIRKMFNDWSQAFPDMKAEITNLISSNDWAVVEEIDRGTHKGPIRAPEGSLAPTNRKVSVPACNIFKISNGKITGWTLYWATEVMMSQLGYNIEKQAA